MPKQEQIIVTPNLNNDTALAYASLTMQELNWPVLLAGENSLVATTKSSWKNKPQQIVCVAVDGQLTIISEMVNGEMADITGKNKKNCLNDYNIKKHYNDLIIAYASRYKARLNYIYIL